MCIIVLVRIFNEAILQGAQPGTKLQGLNYV
jgi:hypothetical protein